MDKIYQPVPPKAIEEALSTEAQAAWLPGKQSVIPAEPIEM